VWDVKGAVGSGTWPEFLAGRVHDFRVERADGRISALVHKGSGRRRERAKIEAAISKVKPNGKGERDIRHLVGTASRPLLLDDDGRAMARPKAARPTLPVVRAR
jgi:hypothetical protein